MWLRDTSNGDADMKISLLKSLIAENRLEFLGGVCVWVRAVGSTVVSVLCACLSHVPVAWCRRLGSERRGGVVVRRCDRPDDGGSLVVARHAGRSVVHWLAAGSVWQHGMPLTQFSWCDGIVMLSSRVLRWDWCGQASTARLFAQMGFKYQ